MEWIVAGVALLIIAAFVFVTVRSERRSRVASRPDNRRARGGDAVMMGAIVAGSVAADGEDSDADPADGAGGSDGGGGGDSGTSGGGWGGGDGGGGGGDGGGGT